MKTEEKISAHHPGREEVNVEGPRPSGKPWLPAALTLLGSSGVITVFGPITGELYWEGYLAAFGLSPEEFPASSSRIRVYAYNAIVEGVGAVYLSLKAYAVLAFVLFLCLLVLAVAFEHMRTKQGAIERSIVRLIDAIRTDNRVGLALRMFYVILVGTISLLTVSYVAVTFLVLVISPTEARKLGLRQGQKQLAELMSKRGDAATCESVEAADFKAQCPTVLAYGDKTLAVFSSGRIYRIARNGAQVASPIPTPASAPIAALSAASRARQ